MKRSAFSRPVCCCSKTTAEHFLPIPEIAFTDSCAYDETSYMAAWRERKLVIDLWFDARGGTSAKFSALARMQKTYLPLRETAKRAYLGIAEIKARVQTTAASWTSMLKRAGKPAPANEFYGASMQNMSARQTDIAIIGGGLAGSLAAAMLGRAGADCVLIDPHETYPDDFRCEKLDGPQLAILRKTGLPKR